MFRRCIDVKVENPPSIGPDLQSSISELVREMLVIICFVASLLSVVLPALLILLSMKPAVCFSSTHQNPLKQASEHLNIQTLAKNKTAPHLGTETSQNPGWLELESSLYWEHPTPSETSPCNHTLSHASHIAHR